jgi:hypothetical protein
LKLENLVSKAFSFFLLSIHVYIQVLAKQQTKFYKTKGKTENVELNHLSHSYILASNCTTERKVSAVEQ